MRRASRSSRLLRLSWPGLWTWVMAAALLAGWRPASRRQATDSTHGALLAHARDAFSRFPERHPSYLTAAQKNLAVRFEWVNDTDLSSLQAWQDDNETGHRAPREDGRPATVGYRFEGLAHGVWYYLRPDSTLAEARLYALGRCSNSCRWRRSPTHESPELAPAMGGGGRWCGGLRGRP